MPVQALQKQTERGWATAHKLCITAYEAVTIRSWEIQPRSEPAVCSKSSKPKWDAPFSPPPPERVLSDAGSWVSEFGHSQDGPLDIVIPYSEEG